MPGIRSESEHVAPWRRATSRTAIAGPSASERSCGSPPAPNPDSLYALHHAWSRRSRESPHRRGRRLGSGAGRERRRRRRRRRARGVRRRRAADGPCGRRLLPRPRRRRRADAARLLLRRPVTAAGADGRGGDRLRRCVDAGVPRRRRRRSPFPGSSPGSPRRTRATGGSRGRRCSSPRSSSPRPASRCTGPQRFLLEILVPILERTEEGTGIYGSHVARRDGGDGARARAAARPRCGRGGRAHAGPRCRPRRVPRRSSGARSRRRSAGCGSSRARRRRREGRVVAGGLAAIDACDRADARTRSPSRSSRRCSRGYGGTSRLAPLTGHDPRLGDRRRRERRRALLDARVRLGRLRRGFQLNNMLGELDVIGTDDRHRGDRLPSMMAPTLVLDGDAPRLVVGSAGSVQALGRDPADDLPRRRRRPARSSEAIDHAAASHRGRRRPDRGRLAGGCGGAPAARRATR